MTQVFVELYEAYKASTVNSVKSVLLDAMISYAKSYHEGYVCYDMDMYTTIYKCAFNDLQRSDVLNQIKSIIVDSALKNDELIEKDENAQKYLKMLNKFVELINTGLASLHIVQYKKKNGIVKKENKDKQYNHLKNRGKWRLKKPKDILTERKNGVINTLKSNESNLAEEYEKVYKDLYDIKSETKNQAEQ